LGDGQLWRIDPTGQFWKCNAIVLGRDADKAEEALYKRLVEADEEDGPKKELEEVLREMTGEEAMEVLCDCMNRVVWPEKPAATPMPVTAAISGVHWQAVILKDDGKSELPKRIFRRGAFLPPNVAVKSTT
jgi:20S proteasome alpha/beta subunit